MLWLKHRGGLRPFHFLFFFFSLRVFCSGPFKKVFIEFITILVYVLVFWPRGMWNPSSQPWLELVSPALESEVLAIGPPGTSRGSDTLYFPSYKVSFGEKNIQCPAYYL